MAEDRVFEFGSRNAEFAKEKSGKPDNFGLPPTGDRKR
jgi:hypothetical protein